MNRKTLMIVGALTAVALVAAVAVQRGNKPASEFTARAGALLPELAPELDSLGKLRLSGAAGADIVTLERSDKGWVVANRGGYPADAAKLREFVLTLADAKTIEAKTSNPERYPDLGVEDVTAADAKGVLVELEGLSKPARFIVGHINGGGGGGTFVRRADEQQTWLTGATLNIERGVADWIARDLADLPSSQIRSVSIDKAGKTLRVEKSTTGDGNFVIADLPKGRVASSEYAANGLASMLAGLRVDDVLDSSSAEPPSDAIKARYTLFDGTVISATAWTVDGRHLARFAANLDEAAANDWIALEQAKADQAYEEAREAVPASGEASRADAPAKPLALSDPEQDRKAKREAIQAQVDQLASAFGQWTFVIPAYKFELINKSIDDLLAPAATAKAASSKQGS